MFLRLINNSFIKKKPIKNSDVFSIYNKKIRGSIVVNDSASSILELCDGTNSINDVILLLKKKYKENTDVVTNYVTNFLSPLLKCGVIEEIKFPQKNKFIIRGSKEVYYPDAICWEITDYCPLNCKHCYLQNKNKNQISKKSIDDILFLIDLMGVFQVQLTGGEALTHPYLEYMIDQLVTRGIIVSVSTSASYYDENTFRSLLKLKNVKGSSIRVSLDGNKATHNYIRNNEKIYDKAIEFISKACKMGIPCQIGTTLVSQTKEELEDLVSLVKKLGVYFIEIGTVCEQGNALENSIHCQYDPVDFKKFLKQLSFKYADKNFSIELPKESKQKNCGAGYGLIRIKPDLSITPCPMTEFYLGNLKDAKIQEIMKKSNEVFCDLESPQVKYCKGCQKENECKNCTAQGVNNKNKVDNCIWYKNVENKLMPYLK